ncbi:hypothetical protein ACL90Y_06855 [Micrococcus luteus]
MRASRLAVMLLGWATPGFLLAVAVVWVAGTVLTPAHCWIERPLGPWLRRGVTGVLERVPGLRRRVPSS